MKIIKIKNLPEVPSSHEDQNDPGVWKRVLATFKDLQGGIQMINWARLGINRSFNPHYHEDMEEVFIILKGKVRLITDGKEFFLNEQEAVIIKAGEVHLMENISSGDTIYLAIGVSLKGKGRTVNI